MTWIGTNSTRKPSLRNLKSTSDSISKCRAVIGSVAQTSRLIRRNPHCESGRERPVNFLSRRLEKLTGRSLPDSQCGLRLMSVDVWATLPITARHFEIESEVLLRFLSEGLRVEFVPIQVIYKGEQ